MATHVYQEKTYNKFKAEKIFFQRVVTIQDFLTHAEPDSDYFGEMFAYFAGFCKNFSTVNELVVSSYLLIHKIGLNFPYLQQEIELSFNDLFEQIDDIGSLFSKIDDTELKKEFLVQIKKHVDNWADYYIDLFNQYQSKYIIDELISYNKMDEMKKLFSISLDRYRELREAFVWLTKNIIDESWFKQFNFSIEKLLICMVHLLDISFREINNRRDVSLNRKINKQINDFLFKEGRLIEFLMEADEDSITRIYTLLDDIKELDPSLKIQIKHQIKEKYPDFRFIGETVRKKVKQKMLVTKESFENKQRELKHLLEVEVPMNSKEIGEAMAKGDLRENSEYKAALEKQDLLSSTCAKLRDGLRNAQIFDRKVDEKRITFGTKIVLINNKTNEKEEFTVLGPWESDPAKKIISYLSPFGANIYNRKESEEIEFTINEKQYHYKVESIQAAI